MASCLGGHFGSQDYVPVAEFYADKSVFVTGGTGFMGKVRKSILLSLFILHFYCILVHTIENHEIKPRLPWF